MTRSAPPATPAPSAIQALPAPSQPTPHANTEPGTEPNTEPSPDARLSFTPVPRLTKRWNGLTPLKQRTFIETLANCGSVDMAARAIATSDSALYQLRRAEGAESFAAAWEVAIEMGARRVLDLLMDHAIHGTPEKLIKDGGVILERRKYNTRAMMWIVQQRFPEQYGGNLNVTGGARGSMPHSIRKLKQQWHAEWEAEWTAKHNSRASEEETTAAITRQLKVLRKRTWHKMYVPWMDNPEKRAACDLLYGKQDWPEIRARARRDELNGALEPEEEARLRGG